MSTSTVQEDILKLYQDGDQTGRQFPAGTWSIDFLAVDAKKNELVVIEPKRGQTSDATIGQHRPDYRTHLDFLGH